MQQDLVETSNKSFRNLKDNRGVTEKELKYFKIDFGKTTNLGELYLLPKIHTRLSEVPGKQVIPNYGTPTEKLSQLWNSELKLVFVRRLVVYKGLW